MLAARLHVFAEWHRGQGRRVVLDPPLDDQAREIYSAMAIDLSQSGAAEVTDAILPVTSLDSPTTVEAVAESSREILEYQLHNVSPLGHATFMAVSELCGNAIEHGRNQFGAFAALAACKSRGNRCQSRSATSESGFLSTFASNFPSGGMTATP